MAPTRRSQTNAPQPQAGPRNASARIYHPLYSSPDADLVLASEDNVYYRAHSFILKMASGFLREMHAMPRDPAERADDPLPMGGASDVVTAALDIIYPDKSLPAIVSVDFAWRLLSFAERYEMPAVTSTVRTFVNMSQLLAGAWSSSLGVYALACRYGWDSEAKLALARSLAVDVSLPAHAGTMRTLDSASLLRVLNLRWDRKARMLDAMKVSLSVPTDARRLARVHWLDIRGCPCIRNRKPHPRAWNLLMFHIAGLMEKDSTASQLRGQAFWDTDDFARLWGSKCMKCNLTDLNQANTKKAILCVLDSLPRNN